MSDRAYEQVTAEIVKALEAGTVPWHKPWNGTANRPRSIHGHAYRGLNAFILSIQPFGDPRWLTFNQCRKMGGRIKKGSKGVHVLLWKPFAKVVKVDPTEAEGSEEQVKSGVFATTFVVFNVEQTEGLDLPALAAPVGDFDPIEAAEAIWSGMPNPPSLDENGGDRAYYVPSQDAIHLPKRETFESPDAFYRTMFHEIVHSTGAESRCNRPEVTTATYFGSENYGREELVAELGSAFLSSDAGLAGGVLESAAYVSGWLKAIKGDVRLVATAAARAQKAADYILGVKAE